MSTIIRIKQMSLGAAAVVLTLMAGGCSSFATRGIAVHEPVVTLNTLASADPQFVAAPFSLVAADSIGLATFGQQIVREDMSARNGSFAEAN